MIKFTTFVPQRIIETVEPSEKSSRSILISLNSTLDTPGTVEAKINHDAWSKVLKLKFHDSDKNGSSIDIRIQQIVEKGYEIKLFDENHAGEILRFLYEHQNHHDYAIVNCEGGISRSAAVSKFIADVYGLQFPEQYSIYNKHVYRVLHNTYNDYLDKNLLILNG